MTYGIVRYVFTTKKTLPALTAIQLLPPRPRSFVSPSAHNEPVPSPWVLPQPNGSRRVLHSPVRRPQQRPLRGPGPGLRPCAPSSRYPVQQPAENNQAIFQGSRITIYRRLCVILVLHRGECHCQHVDKSKPVLRAGGF